MKKIRFKAIAAILAIVLAAAAVYAAARLLDGKNVQPRSTQESTVGTYRRVEYNGCRYVRKSDIDTVLLIGVDQAEGSVRKGYRSGGQADFLMLLVIDNKDRTVRPLHIDRDTMTNITVLGVLGQKVGTNFAQICLSHGFGATEEENSGYTVEAVKNLLEGENIDFYVTVNVDSVPALNDALGGVTVTLGDDYSMFDPEMIKGKTMTLHGKQAEYFVRSRYSIADGSNAKRMERQKTYMDAVKTALQEKAHADSGFVKEFLNEVAGLMHSDAALGRIVNVFSNVAGYEVLPVEYLPGEHMIGSDGFVEYHVTEEDTAKWVLNTLYREE